MDGADKVLEKMQNKYRLWKRETPPGMSESVSFEQYLIMRIQSVTELVAVGHRNSRNRPLAYGNWKAWRLKDGAEDVSEAAYNQYLGQKKAETDVYAAMNHVLKDFQYEY